MFSGTRELPETTRRWRPARSLAFALWLAVLGFAVGSAPSAVLAQTSNPSPSQSDSGGLAANFLNPFPENETWRAVFVGDYLAEGFTPVMADAMSGETRLQIQRKHRPLAGLARVDIEDDIRALDDFVVREKAHVAVIMLGMADRGGLRLPNGQRLQVGQPDWRVQYGARVERIVRALRRRGVAVYWVGLPVMRRSDWSEDIETMNDVIRERVLNSGARYVDAYKASADENGQFNERGPDISGKSVRLRDPDGYSFTPAGYRKLAFFLERDMKRDMTAAREERSIPLAGTDAEQKRINPETAREQVTVNTGANTVGAAAKDARASSSPVARAITDRGLPSPGQQAETAQAGDMRADNVRVSFKTAAPSGREEQVTMEILRPALTQSLIQLVTRRDRGDKPSEVGETLTDTLSNGMQVMRSVTPVRGSGERAASRAALTQQPFYIALSKGERVPSKPGRADDFRWPRADDIPLPPQVQPAAVSAPAPGAQPAKGLRPRPPGAPRPQSQRPETPSPSSVFGYQ